MRIKIIVCILILAFMLTSCTSTSDSQNNNPLLNVPNNSTASNQNVNIINVNDKGYVNISPAQAGLENGFEAITQSENLILYFYKDAQRFAVYDKRSAKCWQSGVTDAYYGNQQISNILKRNKFMLFNYTYVDTDGNTNAVNNLNDEITCTFEQISGGISIHATDTDAGISFDINLTLGSESLNCVIPRNKVKDGVNRIVTIELLPFFGASKNSENGYDFYPDGSGVLYEFKEKAPASVFPVKKLIYGDSFSSMDDLINSLQTGIKSCMLPVFGVKQGDSAICGIVETGASDTTLCFAPSGYIYSLNRIYPIFNYRYSFDYQTVNGDDAMAFEKTSTNTDFAVSYQFLNGADANYSGMARAYRNYLLTNKLLNQSTYQPKVSLDLLTTINKPMLLWEENVKATSFSDATNILKTLVKNGINGVKLNLLGWQSNGYNVFPSHFPVSSNAGGDGGLKSLVNNAKKYSALVSINDNFMLANQNRSGYSKRNDIAYNISNAPYSDANNNYFLLDTKSVSPYIDGAWTSKAKSDNIKAVNFDMLGSLIYDDGAQGRILRRNQMVESLEGVFAKANKNFSILSVGGGNSYALKYADMLYDIPESSSEDYIFDKDVPFFQLVVHGYIPYTPEIPGNLSDNYDQTVLKWIEYGFVPYYSLSQCDASALKDCYTDGVFVSKYSDWEKKITATVSKYNKLLSGTTNQPMYSNETTDTGLSIVTYENGTKVIINYSNNKAVYSGQTILPQDFIVIK